MLQAAFGGYFLVEGDLTVFVENPTYYESGFNIMSPLEISSPTADRIYILIRKRTDSLGSLSGTLDPNVISANVVDATNDQSLPVLIFVNDINELWDVDPSDYTPLVIQIDNQLNIDNPRLKVRVIDCSIKDTTDNSFINFRITVDNDNDSSQYFHYIPVNRKTLVNRNTFTAFGREAYVTLSSDSDSYVLFSPYAWLKETTKGRSHFSYPQDSIYYERQDTFNKEDFDFSLSSWSHSFIEDQLSIMNIPGYKKAGIVVVDNMLYNHIVEEGSNVNATISVTGELSGISDTFKINFYSS